MMLHIPPYFFRINRFNAFMTVLIFSLSRRALSLHKMAIFYVVDVERSSS